MVLKTCLWERSLRIVILWFGPFSCFCLYEFIQNYHNVNLNYVQSVPVDCEVFQGSSTITVEHLTGEVKPVERKVGDSIPGGARNLDGMMIVKVCLHMHLLFSFSFSMFFFSNSFIFYTERIKFATDNPLYMKSIQDFYFFSIMNVKFWWDKFQ